MSQPDRHRHRRLAVVADGAHKARLPVPALLALEDAGGVAGAADGGGEGDGEGELLLVGELAKQTGKTVRAIHLYEDLGLLRPHDRSKGRYRLFSREALLRVRWIAKLQSLGLSLAEIQQLVREQEGSGSAQFAAAKLRQVYLEKLEQTRSKLKELNELEQELEASLKFLNTCDSACEPAVPLDGCSCCERHADPHAAPDLVAGVHAQ